MSSSPGASSESPAKLVGQVLREFMVLRQQAERAFAQIDDTQWFATIDEDANSVAVLVKHVSGNLRSRWREPLTTDGEKPDRDRDGEFVIAEADSRVRLMEAWTQAFALVDATLVGLSDADLERPVVIRGQAQPLVSALLRSLTHVAGHVGQIVMLCRHLAGPAWTTLSIPRGGSARHAADVRTGARTDRGGPPSNLPGT